MKSVLAFVVLALVLTIPGRADTAMGDSMKKMEEAAKRLGTDLKLTDATKHNKDADLQDVATIKAECLKSKDQVPKKAQTLPDDQKQTMTTDFQKSMDTFVSHVDQLSADIQAEKWDVASTEFQALMKEQHDDHKQYRIKK